MAFCIAVFGNNFFASANAQQSCYVEEEVKKDLSAFYRDSKDDYIKHSSSILNIEASLLKSLKNSTSAVGRLEVVMERFNPLTAKVQRCAAACTGSLIDPTHIITAYHCIPGDGSFKIASAVIRFGFNYDDYVAHPGSEFELVPPSPENKASGDKILDFSIVEVKKAVSPAIAQPLLMSYASANINAPLGIIHHPMGLPKRYTDACQITRIDDGQNGSLLRFSHNCETLEGSSGAPIFDLSMIKRNNRRW